LSKGWKGRNLKEIPLIPLVPEMGNQKAIVDDEDYDRLIKYKWYLNAQGYAVRYIEKDGKRVYIRMHREIFNTPEGLDTDHKERNNRTDNRKENLRSCTRGDNSKNSNPWSTDSKFCSIYKGVTWHNRKKHPWVARIRVNRKYIHLGVFKTEIEAALAYNEAARKYFKEFAYQNDIKCQP
jgi:hypothetical protein